MFCEKCGTQVPEGSKWCHKCGSPIKAAGEAPAPQTAGAAHQPMSKSKSNLTVKWVAATIVHIASLGIAMLMRNEAFFKLSGSYYGSSASATFGMTDEAAFDELAPLIGTILTALFLLAIALAAVLIIYQGTMGRVAAVLSDVMTVCIILLFFFEFIMYSDHVASEGRGGVVTYSLTFTLKGVVFPVLLVTALVASKMRRKESKEMIVDRILRKKGGL